MLPSKKISQTLLEFAEPLINELADDYSNEELEGVLKIATTAWNACVVDQWHGNTEFADALRQQASSDPLLAAVVADLMERKETSFGSDLRAISNVCVVQSNGQRVVRAEARLDVQHMTIDGQHAH